MGKVFALDLVYKSPSLRAWILEDHLIVTKFPEPEIHIWNPTAAVLWLILVEGKKSLEELVLQVTDLFENCSPHIQTELAACLENWIDKQWVKLNKEGKYFIFPRLTHSALDYVKINPPQDPSATINKLASINGHVFRLIIRIRKSSDKYPFLSRLTAIASGFLEVSSDPISQLMVVIDSDAIYLKEDSQEFIKLHDQAEALTYCIQYFLKISAGKLNHFLTLHAAAIGQENCILLSGVSGAGKSTLCALLALNGWDYFGDDLVGLIVNANAEGHLVPLPSAISIKNDNWDLLSRHYPEFSMLEIVRYGGKFARHLPLPISDKTWNKEKLIKGIIFPKYSQNSKTAYHSISVIDALGELVNAGVSLHIEMNPEEVESFLKFLCLSPLYRLEYSDINEVNTWLSTLATN